MENNNTDWMAVQTQVGDSASFADIYNMGVDPSSVMLDTKSAYKDKKKIKENPTFQTNGKFDDKKFDQYYDMSVKTYNAYKASDFSVGAGNMPEMNLWEDTTLAKALGQKTYKDPISIKINKNPENNLKIAQKSNLGFIDLNQWSDPLKSIAEVAQGQKVLDGATGKELGFTPEENGLSNGFGFFNEPLVLSAYDEDIKDEQGNILHKKGETKFDAKGLPRYETLAGRNASGKQLMSRWDTLTKENSYINKFDFMDSDDLNKSLGGSIVKAGVQILPLALGGPISTIAKAYFIADGLIQAGTELGKALSGIAGGKDASKSEFYRGLNNIQAYTKQFKGGTSEAGRANFFSAESILNLASDSVYQLMGQQAISMWPQRIKQYQIAKSLNLNPSLMKSLTKEGDEVLSGIGNIENYIAKYGDDFGKSVSALSKNIKQLENLQKYSSYGATAFMSATSAVAISDVADASGLDARDKGLLYLGYTAALAPLFRSNVGNWVEKGFEIDQLAKMQNAAIKKWAPTYLSVVTSPKALAAEEARILAAKEVKESLTGLAKLKGRGLDILLAGKKLGTTVAAKFENITHPLIGGLAEGVEEVTEEMLMDGLKGVYNGLSELGLTSTKDKQIDFDLQDVMARYGQAFVGGAVGGMVFKLVDPDVKIKPLLTEDLKEYVAAGYGDDLIRRITEMSENGEMPGSKTLSINRLMNADGTLEDDVWAPVNSDNPVSQSDFIADRMIKEIRANMQHMQVFGLDNPDAFTDGKNKFYDAIVDTRTDTDLRDRIRSTSDRMIELSNEIKGIEDNEINAPVIKQKKEKFKEIQEEFEYLTGDESIDEYFRQGLFNISSGITSKLGVKTRESFTKELIGYKSNYATLNEEDKAKVDAAYDKYRTSNDDTNSIRVDLRNARLLMESFHQEMEENGGYESIENFNESLKTLGEYANVQKAIVDGEATPFDIIKLMQDYTAQMDDVQYIPDFIHEEITGNLDRIKKTGLDIALRNAIADKNFNPELFRLSLLDGQVNYINTTTPIGKLFKNYLSKFTPINVLDSPEFAAIKEAKELAGLSGMIKVLAQLSSIEDNGPEKGIYLNRARILSEITPQQAEVFLIKYALDNDTYNENIKGELRGSYPNISNSISDLTPEQYSALAEMLEEIDYEQILDEAYEDEGIEISSTRALEILRNINKVIFFNLTTGASDFVNLEHLKATSNILMDQVLEQILDASVEVSQLADLDKMVDEEIAKIEKALKTKATSPLATFLANTIHFRNTEFERLNKVGAANYVDHSEDFDRLINENIVQVERVSAFLEGLVKVNPIINDWREKNADILPDEVKGEELTILTPLAAGTIYQNGKILLNELQYLKALNDFNKNNTLAKLLKEDGKQLSTSFRTLEKISLESVVLENLPSLNTFLSDPVIRDYIADFEAASDADKIAALGAAAKHETNLYNDFQALNPEVKQTILDVTFKPINSSSYDYRKEVEADAPLNDMHQTVYLAKIFGTSSIAYTKAIAGEPEEEGKYTKITAALMDPFPNQEGAIRLAYLNRFGDPLVKDALAAAFSFRRVKESVKTFKLDKDGVDITDVIAIVGDPGVGKTKAIVAGILSFDDNKVADTVLLGTVSEHVQNLSEGVTNAGFDNRINKELSSTIADFISELEITDKDNKIVDFFTNATETLQTLKGSNFKDNADYESDRTFQSFLKKLTDSFVLKAALWEDNGTFNPGLAKKLKGIRNIIIDEFTHANPIDLAIIIHVVSEYNRSIKDDLNNKITITLAGDNNQEGFQVGDVSRTFADFVQVPTSTPLTTSLRSGWDLVNNTLIEIKDRTAGLNNMSDEEVTSPAVASGLKAIPVKLFHTVKDDSPIGFFNQIVDGETTIEDLKFLSDHVTAITAKDNSLVYIVNEASQVSAAEALMRSMLGPDWKKYATVLTTKQTQGREYKYAIVDAKPNTSEKYALLNGYKFLNTMLSRATEATLVINKKQFDNIITFEQLEVPQAIDQKKLTDEMLVEIKANRQAIVDAKLKGFVETTDEIKTNPLEATVTDTPPTDAKTEPISDEDYRYFTITYDVSDEILKDIAELVKAGEAMSPRQKDIYDIKATEIEALIAGTQPGPIETELPKTAENENLQVLDQNESLALLLDNTGASSPAEPIDEFVRTSKYMVYAYTSFTFKRDVDNARAIINKPNLTDLDIEGDLMKLKEMAVYTQKEFGGAYFSAGQLMDALKTQGFSIAGTKVKIRAVKRTADLYTVGRSKWNNNYQERDGEDLLIVEGIIPNKLYPNKNFVYTLGTFNSLTNIMKAGGDVASVREFVNNVKDKLDTNQEWSSPELTLKEWQSMISRKEFKTEFADQVNDYADLKRNYNKNMTLTEPHVVIGTSNSTANLDVWKSLIGKSVVFATEHAVLRGQSPQSLFEIYKLQLEYFNSPAYQDLASYEEKEAYINSKPKLQIPGFPPFTVRPRQVALIKLTNPKHNFIEFVTKYNTLVYKQKMSKVNNQQVNMQEEVKNFEMSVYVADRLVKSMMVLHRMLTDENSTKNREWFEANVIPKVKGNVLTEIKTLIDMELAELSAMGEPIGWGTMTPEDFVKNETDITALRSVDDLVSALDKYLYGNPTLVKGIYKTTGTNLNKVRGVDLDPAVNMMAVLPELSTDKQKDFTSNGILKVKNLSIYNGLQGSFLKMVNESLIALGSLSKSDAQLGKYSLEDVFKNGQIENIIIAGVGSNGRHINNVIAPVVTTGLTKGFTTNTKSIQSASFYVDFDKMLAKTGQVGATEGADARIAKEKAEAIEAKVYFNKTIKEMGVTKDFIEYNEAMNRTFKNKEEVDILLKSGLQFGLKPDAVITNSNQVVFVDTSGGSFAFNDYYPGGPNPSQETITSNDKYVTLVADLEDKVITVVFDRANNYKSSSSIVFKQSAFNANDEAKRFIDENQITAEDVVNSSKQIDQDTLARDITTLKGQTIETIDGPREVIGGSIGKKGTMSDSFLTLRNPLTLEMTSLSQAVFPEVLALPVHERAIEKAQTALESPENVDLTTVVDNILQDRWAEYFNVEVVDKDDMIKAILSHLKLTDTYIDNDKSIYNKMLDDIEKNGTKLLEDPFTEEETTPEITRLMDTYSTLAKELYTDKLHIANGFVNNFSIFANDEWKKYQLIIKSAINNPDIFGNPELKNKILNLEQQLIKYTHDC